MYIKRIAVILLSFWIILGIIYAAHYNFVDAQEISNSDYEEVIRNFVSVIDVKDDASFTVTENIEYDFGVNQKHGIYRDIPVSYDSELNNFSVSLKVVSVSDESGKGYKYGVSKDDNNVRIKIGDPDVLITGKHTYFIVYKVDGALLFNDNNEVELYWNVTGDRWPVKIKNVEVQVFLPGEIANKDLKAACFVGAYGSEAQNCSSTYDTETGIIFRTDNGAVLPGEGFTIAVRWPRGELVKSGIFQSIFWFLEDNPILFLPVLYIFVYGFYWWKLGRDPKGRSTIVAQYDPPNNMTPLEVGVLYDQNANNNDLGAGIIHLAWRGFLNIKLVNIKEPTIFGVKEKKDWEFSRNKSSDGSVKDFENKLFEALRVPNIDSPPRLLSSLKDGRFHDFIEDIHGLLYERLVLEGYFVRSPHFTRTISISFGVIPLIVLVLAIIFLPPNIAGSIFLATVTVSFLVGYRMLHSFNLSQKILSVLFVAAIILLDFAYNVNSIPVYIIDSLANFNIILIISVFLCVMILVIFGWMMPKYSVKGRLAYEHILGFKQYLSVAEKDRIKFHNSPDKTPEVFEKFLPYAMVLGVEKEWAKQFEGLTIPAPSWYQGGGVSVWNAIAFTSIMNNTVSDINSTFSAPQPSSSGGGGGGFSGGGFGGGGGGSW